MNARIPDDALPARLDPEAMRAFVDETWDREIVPALTDYIAIPAKSPAFDPDWEKNQYIERVVRDAAQWVQSCKVAGLTLEVVRLPGRTPVIYFDAPATRKDNGDTVLMYGHLDKQPEFSGWRNGLGPWTPKYEDGKLYGRGGADDGYAVYASLTAIMALDRQGVPRPRCVGLIETCEESGSYDLLPYVDALRERLGNVALVVCLDSGAGNYEQLWMTRCWTKACIQAIPAVWCLRASAYCAICWIVWKIVPQAVCCPKVFIARSLRSASSRRALPHAFWARKSGDGCPGAVAPMAAWYCP
jgi:hypothetical protein